MLDIGEMLRAALDVGVTDVFISASKRCSRRRGGAIEVLDSAVVEAADVERFRRSVAGDAGEQAYLRTGSFDISWEDVRNNRFRLNFFLADRGPGLVVRPVPEASSLNFETLGMPSAVREIVSLRRGLVLFCGAAGSGKSTSMNAVVSEINRVSPLHIITVEDPIEYVHQDDKSLITQREVHTDVADFAAALRSAVRESPDVLAVGEMRDEETMRIALAAALTGHLVLSTVHASDTVQALERIVNAFPEHLREQAAADLGAALGGVFAQRLIPAATGGFAAAFEVLKMTPNVRNLVAARDYAGLDDALRRADESGMMTFNRALFELWKQGGIALEDAAAASSGRDEFMLLAKGMESGVDAFRDFTGGDESAARHNMRQLLKSAIANHASDLLLSAGSRPVVRLDGELTPLDTEALSGAEVQKLLFSLLTPRQSAEFEKTRELDFALSVRFEESDLPPTRFRINGFYQRGAAGMAARVVSSSVPAPQELGIPPVVVRMAEKKQGLVLITGPTGHGKSTTLASLIDRINHTRNCHIITVEDPIEYVHANDRALIEQREIHADTLSFANALKYVLRQDPDVILIGEMRDPETIAAALTAAETGHLVFATLHTNSAPQTIDRIIDSFPGHQQNQIKIQLSSVLLGVVAQRLFRKADGTGRVAAFEVMVGIPAVQSLIREGKTNQLQSVLETSFRDGMMTMEKSLEELYQKKLITLADVRSMVRNFRERTDLKEN